MTKKLLIILLIVFIGGGATAGYLWWQREQNEFSETPEEALKEIIKKNIKQEFLPSAYELTDRPEYSPLPSADNTDYYFVEWDIEKTSFSTMVAYNKITPKDLAYYTILIFVEEPDLTGEELANKFLNSLPIGKWSHRGPSPSTQAGVEIEAYALTSTADHNKIFTTITLFLMPNFPEEPIKITGIISYQLYTPSSPKYAEVENFQELFFQANFPTD